MTIKQKREFTKASLDRVALFILLVFGLILFITSAIQHPLDTLIVGGGLLVSAAALWVFIRWLTDDWGKP